MNPHTSQTHRIQSGPSALQLMPAEQQQALDPYMAQIVTYRKSGLSLNHIIGCPLDCGYCVRHFWGDFEHKTPHLLCSTDDAIDMLVGHEAFRPSITPIQLFNKATDPFLPGVKPHLFQVLQALDVRGLDNLVLLITRFKVTAADMAALEQLRHLRVTVLFTYSGIADERIEPIAKSSITVSSLTLACQQKDRTKVVLYFSPPTPTSRPSWTTSATPPTTSSTAATCGPTASANNAATPSNTPSATRFGNSTSRTSCTPTADPRPATSHRQKKTSNSPRSDDNSPPPRDLMMTDGR
jgi:hypothetical protein